MMRVPLINQRRLVWALVLGYLTFCLLYLGSHALSFADPTTLQPSALDAHIPLLDNSIWIYFSQFLLLPLSLIYARDAHERSHVYYAALLATSIAALIFLIWPTQLDRPAITATGLTGTAWAMLFATDTDGNCFPSLHVALAALSGVSLWRIGWRYLAVIWPLLIALATLTTKQHIVWDTLAGLVLAVLSWALTPRLLRYE
jgi:membrane-associated phospholipid phosphatase